MSATALQAIAVGIALVAVLVAAVLAWWEAGRPLDREMLFLVLIPFFLLSGRPSWLWRSAGRRTPGRPESVRAGGPERRDRPLHLVRGEADES